jgi:excinuclease ABC subunit A
MTTAVRSQEQAPGQPSTGLTPIEQLDPRHYILIKGASVHNLKNLDVAIPRNQLVVITGLSGSGKSSLAFDTLFAEGQRMYVESLSSYARQFLGRMEKPQVEYIKGVSPAISIEQKVSTRNPRSTVGTSTEIYDYLKLLFARVGITYSPVSGQEVKKDTVSDVVNYIQSFEDGRKLMILAPLPHNQPNGGATRTMIEELKILLQKGFTRVVANGELHFIEDILDKAEITDSSEQNISILIDRSVVRKDAEGNPDEDSQFRLSDSVQTAFFEGEGTCEVEIIGLEKRTFSDKFELDGLLFEEPSINLFSFNNPFGACKRCEGFGKVLGIDEELVFPDKQLSVYQGAVAPWRTDKMSEWQRPLVKNAAKFDFPIHRPYKDLTDAEKQLLWDGNAYFDGLHDFFRHVEVQTHKIQYRVMLSRYRGRTTCPECRGTRLRKDAAYVKIAGKSISDLVLMPISNLLGFFRSLQLPDHQATIARRILVEISNRLDYLDRVGLGYLTLNRLTNSLSGGEYQRIKLATSLGSALVGSMYILDEPSIGLHPRDTQKLVSVLEMLRDMGNTVIVVEHEEEVMRAADQLIDIGPEAGSHGGQLVFQGTLKEAGDVPHGNGNGKDYSGLQAISPGLYSHTINFLNGTDRIEIPKVKRKWTHFVEVKGARENNLKYVDVKFPLGVLTVVTGVSGSGKSTLIRKVLYPALSKLQGQHSDDSGKYGSLEGSLDRIKQTEFVDQNPIGKSSRSNPITYIKAYDYIRSLMADQPLAKVRSYKPSHFSFNVDGGRCEVCQGEGTVTVEMQFMADLHLTCESCAGKRFKQEILEVKYQDKDIAEILDMTVDDSLVFFHSDPKLIEKLLPLQEVGLGYVRLGQSSDTLSGGEAQRVKLASFLGKGHTNKGATLFIFDEPTTGLHFHDIKKLLRAINALVDQGDSVVIIEHNMEMIKSADWIIDLGPEGGDGGGYVTFAGLPEDLIKLEDNYTAKFLKDKFTE